MLKLASKRDGRGQMVGYRSTFDAGLLAPPPLQIAGCTLFLRASSLTGANGSAITTWADESGNARNASQATSGKRPTVAVANVNNQNAIRLTASSAQSMSTTNLFSGTAARTVFVVYRSLSTGSFSTTVVGQQGTANSQTWFDIECRTEGATGDPYLTTYAGDISGPSPDNQWKVATATYGSGAMQLFRNGVSLGTSNITLNTNNVPFYIGATLSGSESAFFDGYIAEIIAYNSVLSAANRVKIETYLNSKYTLY